MKVLPFADKPMFLCYHNKAFPFGIIQANSPEDITKWACTKCINFIASSKPKSSFNISVWDVWGINEGILYYQALHIKKDLIQPFGIDLLHVLKTAINNNCYIHGMYNEKYIPNKWAFEHQDFMHDFLIIGCDNEKFLSVGYLANGRFERFEIPNKNFIDSLYNYNEVKIGLDFFSYQNNATKPLDINIKRMIDDLKKYISFSNYAEHLTLNEDSYGIPAHIKLREYFVDEVRNKGKVYIDRRFTRVLLEHKWIMSKVVDLFLDGDKKQTLQQYSNKNFERARCIHMLGLKMSYTGDADIVDRIGALIDEIIVSELEYIPVLINALQNKYSIS